MEKMLLSMIYLLSFNALGAPKGDGQPPQDKAANLTSPSQGVAAQSSDAEGRAPVAAPSAEERDGAAPSLPARSSLRNSFSLTKAFDKKNWRVDPVKALRELGIFARNGSEGSSLREDLSSFQVQIPHVPDANGFCIERMDLVCFSKNHFSENKEEQARLQSLVAYIEGVEKIKSHLSLQALETASGASGSRNDKFSDEEREAREMEAAIRASLREHLKQVRHRIAYGDGKDRIDPASAVQRLMPEPQMTAEQGKPSPHHTQSAEDKNFSKVQMSEAKERSLEETSLQQAIEASKKTAEAEARAREAQSAKDRALTDKEFSPKEMSEAKERSLEETSLQQAIEASKKTAEAEEKKARRERMNILKKQIAQKEEELNRLQYEEYEKYLENDDNSLVFKRKNFDRNNGLD